MAVLDLDGWTARIQITENVSSTSEGDTNFSNAIGDLTDPLNVIGGAPGVLTFARSIFKVQLDSLVPTASTSWAALMAAAWGTAITASVITPGTVTDPAWSGSGNKDTVTLTTGAAVITNIAAAQASLQASLLAIDPSDSNRAMAKAFRDATLTLLLTCIGLGPPPPLPPIPIVKGVE